MHTTTLHYTTPHHSIVQYTRLQHSTLHHPKLSLSHSLSLSLSVSHTQIRDKRITNNPLLYYITLHSNLHSTTHYTPLPYLPIVSVLPLLFEELPGYFLRLSKGLRVGLKTPDPISSGRIVI